MSSLTVALVFAAAISTALIGGIFFAFSNFVMHAFRLLPASEGIRAMQKINETVLNVGFLGVFMGAAALSVGLAVMSVVFWSPHRSALVLFGSVAYLVGTWLVTAFGNVPLNNRLAAIDPNDQESVSVWVDYVRVWTRLNSVRTVFSLASAVLFCGVLFIG